MAILAAQANGFYMQFMLAGRGNIAVAFQAIVPIGPYLLGIMWFVAFIAIELHRRIIRDDDLDGPVDRLGGRQKMFHVDGSAPDEFLPHLLVAVAE
jgi:hypothetical protein